MDIFHYEMKKTMTNIDSSRYVLIFVERGKKCSRLSSIHVISSRERKSSIYDSVLFSLLYKDIVLCSETKQKERKNAMIILHIISLGITDLIRFDSTMFRL